MRTPQWIKKLTGTAGEYFVAAELSKRGIINALLPENFSDDDIMVARKDGKDNGSIQVKACHPDRGNSFPLYDKHEEWEKAESNQYVVFVLLGSPKNNEPPRFWIATKKEVGKACKEHPCHGTENSERRFSIQGKIAIKTEWENNWNVFKKYMP